MDTEFQKKRDAVLKAINNSTLSSVYTEALAIHVDACDQWNQLKKRLLDFLALSQDEIMISGKDFVAINRLRSFIRELS